MCYVKESATATFVLDRSYYGDFAVVLDWVYYQDVISKFSIRHYDRRDPALVFCWKNNHIGLAARNSSDQSKVLLSTKIKS
jgi:hypothetical protein